MNNDLRLPPNENATSISIRNIPFYLLCILIPFENTSLASIGGVFTANLAFILMPILVLQILLNINSVNGATLFIIKFFLFFSIFSLSMLYFYVPDYDLEFLADRGLRFLLLAIPPAIIFIAVTQQNYATIKNGILLIFLVVTLSFIVNLIIPDFVNNQSFLQNSSALSIDRMRGFTLEASNFGFQFALAFLLFISAARKNLIVYAPIIIMAVLLIQSKGTLIAFLLSIAIAYATFSKTSPLSKLLLVIIFTLISSVLIEFLIYDQFTRDIERYNSVATRSTVILTSLISLFHTPLGTGFFGFLPSFYEHGITAMNFMDFLFPGTLNFIEFSKYIIIGATEGVSTKSFFFDWVIYGGFVFLYFYAKYTGRLLLAFVTHNQKYEFTIMIFLMICTMFFISIETRYIAAFTLGYLYLSYKKIIS